MELIFDKPDNLFLKDKVPQFWPCLFSFRRCCMHLQSFLMRAGGQILWKKALLLEKYLESNRRPNSSHDFLDFFTAEVAAFLASVYRDC